jgi:hypothetical protein
MLFNIVAYMLTVMTQRAKSDGQIEDVIPYLVDRELVFINTLTIQFFLWNMESRSKKTEVNSTSVRVIIRSKD